MLRERHRSGYPGRASVVRLTSSSCATSSTSTLPGHAGSVVFFASPLVQSWYKTYQDSSDKSH